MATLKSDLKLCHVITTGLSDQSFLITKLRHGASIPLVGRGVWCLHAAAVVTSGFRLSAVWICTAENGSYTPIQGVGTGPRDRNGISELHVI